MSPRIVYTYDKQGRVIAATVSGLVGKFPINRNTATKG
jgi:hypothetical protein